MIAGTFTIWGLASPVIVGLLTVLAVAHACLAPGNLPARGRFFTRKVVVLCVLHLLIVAGACRHLITGGWLSTHYDWSDANNFNLVLACFEAFAGGAVIALLLARRPFFYRLVVDLFYIQMLLAAAVLGFLLLFLLTWHPRMM